MSKKEHCAFCWLSVVKWLRLFIAFFPRVDNFSFAL